MAELLYKDEVYTVIGAAMDVYNHLGPGFLEAIYQEAMEVEVTARNIPNSPEQNVQIMYKGKPLKKFYTPDLMCYGKIVVEIKAIDRLTSREEAQLLNYLKATGMPVGLLINFGAEKDLEWKRMVLTSQKQARIPKVLTPTRVQRINDPKPIRED